MNKFMEEKIIQFTKWARGKKRFLIGFFTMFILLFVVIPTQIKFREIDTLPAGSR